MKNDNGVPRFTYDGTSVTCLGKYELRNSDFYELRNGCPLSIGIVAMTKTKRQFDIVELVGNIFAATLVLFFSLHDVCLYFLLYRRGFTAEAKEDRRLLRSV